MKPVQAAPDPLFMAFQLALAGRYSIDRELGRGGMGIVFLAREVHLDRLVAIKLLPPDRAVDPTLRERFLREARTAANLSHPNIIPIHAVEESSGFVFYVMSFVDGVTLAQRVRTRGPLSSSEGARVLREIAWALAYAHEQGLVHRDVKPDNILLESSTGRVLVADFGIAAAAGDASADGVSGTPEFMSPEQALGRHVDARSDLYGLGATAFYMFSGRFPFEGKSATEILAKHVTEPAPPLSSLGLTVPRKLAALVDRCLAKDPAHRPANAQALAEQLGLALEQRRELPAALRSFVKRSGRVNSGGAAILFGIATLAASVGVSYLRGGTAGFATFLIAGAAGPFALMVRSAQRLMLLGFNRQDLAPAYKAEMEQGREERAVDAAPGLARLERGLSLATRISGGLFFPLVVAMITDADWRLFHHHFLGGRLPAAILIVAGGTMTISGIVTASLLERRRDIDVEFWSRVWMGRIGKLAFSVASKFLGKRTRGAALTHRATELSLGMAVEQLYESLPNDTRRALGELPEIVRRLKDDAQLLRKRHDDLQEAVNDAGSTAAAVEYSDIRAMRDDLHAKLGQTVGALETIRLNLLRLHAGSLSVEGLTTHLGLAAEVSEEVDRLVAAHEEIERSLEFPRRPEPTPV